jgi:hypothetical protein
MEDAQVDFLFSLIHVMTMSNDIRLAASAPCDTSTEWLSRFCVLELDNDEAMIVERSETRSTNVIHSWLRRLAALLSRFDHTHLRWPRTSWRHDMFKTRLQLRDMRVLCVSWSNGQTTSSALIARRTVHLIRHSTRYHY